MGYIAADGSYYEGEMRPGDRAATPAEQAARDAQVAAAAAHQAARQTDVETIKADPTITYLRDHRPAECYAKVQADVTDLASAKAMIGRLAMALCVIVRQV